LVFTGPQTEGSQTC